MNHLGYVPINLKAQYLPPPLPAYDSKKNGPGIGHLPIQQGLHVGHLNSFLELGEGNLTAKNRTVKMPRSNCPEGGVGLGSGLVRGGDVSIIYLR